PTSAEAARLSSKSMTTWVSGGICMSRSSLRVGASEVESDALFGKGSGSNGHWRGSGRRGRHGKLAQQAVALEAFDPDRQDFADDVGGCHHMGGLQVGGAADDLAGIARGPFEQDIDGLADHSLVEGRLLMVDQFLKPHQSLVHLCR